MDKGSRVTPNIFGVLFKRTSVLSRGNRVTEGSSRAMTSLLAIARSEIN